MKGQDFIDYAGVVSKHMGIKRAKCVIDEPVVNTSTKLLDSPIRLIKR